MYVLGIETSCDETASAVMGPDGVLSDVVHTQDVHVAYGGVVPELASRAHVERLGAVVQAALDQAGVRPDAVAVTTGPGLIGALLVGVAWAKGLAAAWDVPFVEVNHIEGHLLAPLIDVPDLGWPFLGLVVSGGHSAVYLCRGLGRYEVLGQTRDDAAGEAYDKVARLLGLGYPGGPVIDRLATGGDPSAIAFPRPLKGSLDMSFSGLKTAVRTWVRHRSEGADLPVADVCASFQAAVVDVLVARVRRAVRQTGVSRVLLAGGVAANGGLRAALADLDGADVYVPPIHRCTDNGAMIAHAGRLHLLAGQRDGLDGRVRPAWQLA